MKNCPIKQSETASLRRAMVRRAFTFALFCIVIACAFALLFYSPFLAFIKNLQLREDLNTFIPGLFDISLLLAVALFLAAIIIHFVSRRGYKSVNETIDEIVSKTLTQAETGAAAEAKIQPPAEIKYVFPDAMKAELESARLLNDLLITLLSDRLGSSARGTEEILNALGPYCKCDFAAIYEKEEESERYVKIGLWDAQPELARHSNKINLIDLQTYRWMHKTVKGGKPFIFRTAMLESVMESVAGAADDVKEWMRQQAQESAEQKLCKHEGWEHFACFPFRDGEELTGLFLVGYQKSGLPVSNEVIERLNRMSAALGVCVARGGKGTPEAGVQIEIQSALNKLEDAIFTTDAEGCIGMVNNSAVMLSGNALNNLVGKPWHNVFRLVSTDTQLPLPNPVIKLTRDPSAKIFLKGVSLISEDGSEISLEGMAAGFKNTSDGSNAVIFILRDVTDRLREENAKAENLRMEAVSSLSSGFAHDFNNILTAILGNISLALDDIPPETEPANLLKAAEESTLKGKEITDKLLAMAKGSPIPYCSFDAVKALEGIVSEMLVGTNVKPIFRLESNLPNIRMSAETFEKIITGTVANSLQAMKVGGVLTVIANSYEILPESDIPASPGSYLCIKIKDTGEGISRENQSRVFVPYFTTKPQASGLGLPIVFSLLKKHGGYIRLHSEQGKGTTCEIFIPTTEAKPQAGQHPTATGTVAPKTALVLDEDDALGNLLIKTLVKLGLRVQHTTDTDELSTLFFKAMNNGARIGLVLADLKLPGANDITNLLSILKKSDPQVKLVAYGNAIHPTDRDEYRQKGFDDVLQKPFNITDLKAVINRNLNI